MASWAVSIVEKWKCNDGDGDGSERYLSRTGARWFISQGMLRSWT